MTKKQCLLQMDNRVIAGAALFAAGLLLYNALQKNVQDEEVPELKQETSAKTIATLSATPERQPFQKLYTILISGKRYSGKQTVAEGLRKQLSAMNHRSLVFHRANVIGGPPVAGNYKTKDEVFKIYEEGMALSSLFYANKTLEMLYDRHAPQEKLVLIISDIRNMDEIRFWKEKSIVSRTVYVDASDDDRRLRGWSDGAEDDYNFEKNIWNFTLDNGNGNDVQKMTTQLFINSLLPSIEGRAEISIITESTVYSKFLNDYAYMLATAIQSQLRVTSISVSNTDSRAIAIAAPTACILQVPLLLVSSVQDLVKDTIRVTTLKTENNGPHIMIDFPICSYHILP